MSSAWTHSASILPFASPVDRKTAQMSKKLCKILRLHPIENLAKGPLDDICVCVLLVVLCKESKRQQEELERKAKAAGFRILNLNATQCWSGLKAGQQRMTLFAF